MRQNTVLDSAAQRLRELHQIGRPLLLVNVWDAAGARAVQVGSSLFRRPSLAAEIAAEFSRAPAAGSPP